MKRLLFPLACLMALALFAGAAQARTSLVQDGKKTVFQRVITHPGAQLFAGPEQGAPVLRESVKTFTAMYIYDNKGDRLEVGVSSSRADGWINARDVTVWPQAITMLFTDRTGRAPVLFFRDHAAIDATCRAPSVKKAVTRYAGQLAGKAPLPPDFPVVASEPQETAVAEKNFYLLPVLNVDRQYVPLDLLEVTYINPGISPAAQTPPAQLRTGFAFVINRTSSMKPYIAQTLVLIRSLYDQLEKSAYKDNVPFCDDTRHKAKTDYTAKVICDFKTVAQRAELEKALATVQEATVSTHDFNEDSFAGIKEAADSLSWQDFGARIMMMVSDAGPLGAGDPHSRTGLSPKALADYLRSHKIYLTVLHAKSPNWHKDHACMELGDDRANCIPLDVATPAKGAEAFDRTARVLVKNYVTMLTATAQMSPGAQQFSLRPDQDLVRNGLLDEVRDGLPYTSAINSMTQRDWESMPSGERDAFIRRIKGLLVRYEAYDKDAANWESFGSPTPNDWVCRVPLSMLP